jgi:NADH-quinone oxidoreductase subunit L
LPLLGAATNGIFGARWPKNTISAVALASTTLAFLAALEAVREFFSLPSDQVPFTKSFFTWISAGGFQADFALRMDQLTVVMLLVVTGVGWLIHIYSPVTCTTIRGIAGFLPTSTCSCFSCSC